MNEIDDFLTEKEMLLHQRLRMIIMGNMVTTGDYRTILYQFLKLLKVNERLNQRIEYLNDRYRTQYDNAVKADIEMDDLKIKLRKITEERDRLVWARQSNPLTRHDSIRLPRIFDLINEIEDIASNKSSSSSDGYSKIIELCQKARVNKIQR